MIYGFNNPLLFTDPDGLNPLVAAGGGVAGAGGAAGGLGGLGGFGGAVGGAKGGYDPRTDMFTPPKPGMSIPGWLSGWLTPNSALSQCEATCDKGYDGDQKYCEAHWKMHGRNSDAYRMCMNQARSKYLQCYQDCKNDCP